MHESQAHWQQDQPSKSFLGCHLSLKGTSPLAVVQLLLTCPGFRRGMTNMFTLGNKLVVSEVSNPVAAAKKPQEIKIRILWAIRVFLRGDQYSFLSVGCFTYTVEKKCLTQRRGLCNMTVTKAAALQIKN